MTENLRAITSSPSGRVAVAIVVGLAVLGLALVLTHGVWFDNPSGDVQRRMDIICQLFVGIGTGALAIVTWASVYETQQVVSGEDLRFRKSRMPMVCLEEVPTDYYALPNTGFGIKVINLGDGPAENVHVSIKAEVIRTWQSRRIRLELGRKVQDQPVAAQSVEAPVTDTFTRVSSYIPSGGRGEAVIKYEPPTKPDDTETESYSLASTGYSLRLVTISYTDVFGEQFTTTHGFKDLSRPLSVNDFHIQRPFSLTAGGSRGCP